MFHENLCFAVFFHTSTSSEAVPVMRFVVWSFSAFFGWFDAFGLCYQSFLTRASDQPLCPIETLHSHPSTCQWFMSSFFTWQRSCVEVVMDLWFAVAGYRALMKNTRDRSLQETRRVSTKSTPKVHVMGCNGLSKTPRWILGTR